MLSAMYKKDGAIDALVCEFFVYKIIFAHFRLCSAIEPDV
jgi:hypothetical protein